GSRALGRRIVSKLVERPPQIDGRRARRRQHLVRRVEVLAAPRRERETVGGGDPDRRGAADRDGPDRVGDVLGRYAPQLELLVGQPPLVEEDDGITFQTDDALRREVARGHRLSLRRGQRRTRDLAGSKVNHCLASASKLPSSSREVSALFTEPRLPEAWRTRRRAAWVNEREESTRGRNLAAVPPKSREEPESPFGIPVPHEQMA